MNKIFLQAQNIVPRIPEVNFPLPISFTMREGEAWTFYGPNGCGKTLLSEILTGKYGLKAGEVKYPFMDEIRKHTTEYCYPRQFIRIVSFRSTYSFSDFRDAYYQQRFNSQEVDYYPTVLELLEQEKDPAWFEQVVRLFNLRPLLEHKLISLSSGQLRRLLIAKTLLERPKMVIFDNPFIGLDVETRGWLNEIFQRMMQEGIQLLFLIPVLRDIPPVTTHVLSLENCQPVFTGTYEDFKRQAPVEKAHKMPQYDFLQASDLSSDYQKVVELKDLSITYGDIVYQSHINWDLRKGEKWALLGPNGSGKSTLLSYIFADNPQAYALPISLFDQKRGTGESIWDIKKRMGYTSSEMHLYYLENVPCLSVVESGYFDSVGLFRHCNEEQADKAFRLMQEFGIEHLAKKSFLRISSGEQRLVLFARALVKNPQVLILDEPLHGMDYANKQACLQLIEQFASQPDKSLIFVTHYQEEIPSCVDHVLQLHAPEFLQSQMNE